MGTNTNLLAAGAAIAVAKKKRYKGDVIREARGITPRKRGKAAAMKVTQGQ